CGRGGSGRPVGRCRAAAPGRARPAAARVRPDQVVRGHPVLVLRPSLARFDREPKVPGRVARLGPGGPSARLSCGLRPRSLPLVGPAKPVPTRPRGAGGSRPPRAPPTTTQRFVLTARATFGTHSLASLGGARLLRQLQTGEGALGAPVLDHLHEGVGAGAVEAV